MCKKCNNDIFCFCGQNVQKKDEVSSSGSNDLVMPFSIGDAVVATADIWDDGEDHHPPGWLAKKGERLIVRRVGSRYISVSHHNVTNASFLVEKNEIRQA